MIFATCASIAAILAGLAGGETVALSGDCPVPVSIKRYYPSPVVIEAGAAKLALIVMTGAGNVTVRGGTVRSPSGAAAPAGPGGYGAWLRDAKRVTLEGMTFTDARKAVAIGGGSDITIRYAHFTKLREDGVIASEVVGLDVSYNVFDTFSPYPTTCTSGATVVTGLSNKACVATGGKWKDGDHSDAIQFYDGVKNATFAFNAINGISQGIGQMGTVADAPLYNVLALGNVVAVSGYHSITFGPACTGCVIRDNVVSTVNTNKTVIRFVAPTTACGNVSQNKGPGTEACK